VHWGRRIRKLNEFNFDQVAPMLTHRNFRRTSVAGSVALACLFNIATAVAGPVTTVRASAAGAKLDSDLLKGGGTDDTRVLQSVLDRAAKGAQLYLIVDGPALVSGLDVYANTTIEFTTGAGLYLKNDSSRAILRNAHRSRGTIADEHIEIRGGFLNGNRRNQPSAYVRRPDWGEASEKSNSEKDGTFISGLQFSGVNDLKIEGLTIWNTRAFGALISNGRHITVRNVVIDDGGGADGVSDEYINTDALHFVGPLQYLTVDSVKTHVGDDAIALNANPDDPDNADARNDFGPFVGQGPITDVSISNVELMETADGFRFESSNERIDRVVVNNVTGTVRYYLAAFSHWLIPSGFGNVGSIILSNVTVDRSGAGWPRDELTTRPDKAKDLIGYYQYSEFNGGDLYMVGVNCHVETLLLRNISTRAHDDLPILTVGPEGNVGTLTAELTVVDPDLRSIPVQLNQGHVEHFNLWLNWHGRVADEGRPPVAWRGGTVGELRWVATPPMYVRAKTTAGDVVAVSFSEDVKAVDFKTGVTIRVDGAPVTIKDAVRGPGLNTVRYVFDSGVNGDHKVTKNPQVTWAYDATAGNIQNLSGDHLPATSAKVVSE
jgi:hypothetical protein